MGRDMTSSCLHLKAKWKKKVILFYVIDVEDIAFDCCDTNMLCFVHAWMCGIINVFIPHSTRFTSSLNSTWFKRTTNAYWQTEKEFCWSFFQNSSRFYTHKDPFWTEKVLCVFERFFYLYIFLTDVPVILHGTPGLQLGEHIADNTEIASSNSQEA